jgi:hypothetical protein
MAVFTQDQVSNWFAQNPNATPELVAKTVQGLGGLEANQGLAGLLAKQYGTDVNTITSGYNTLTAPVVKAPISTPTASVVNAPAAPVATSVTTPVTAPVVNAPAVVKPPAVQTPQLSANEAEFRAWSAANPGADNLAIARQALRLGLTPQQAILNPGANVLDTLRSYAQAVPYAEMQNLYDKGDYTGINTLLAKNKFTPEQLQTAYGLTPAQQETIRGKGVNLGYTTPELQGIVTGIFNDPKLNEFERTNKLLETGQAKGFGTQQLENVYGKPAVTKALDSYKTGIQGYLTNVLNDKTKTEFDKAFAIQRDAKKYGFDIDELVKYGGLDKDKTQTLLGAYDKGLANIVTSTLDPKVDDTTKTATILQLDQKYGIKDADLAKASGGKFTEKQLTDYMNPVRSFPDKYQNVLKDPNSSAKDVIKLLTDAKSDPRLNDIYGKNLITPVLAEAPALYLNDALNDKGSIAKNYTDFLEMAKSTPELAAKYAKQIQGVEKMLGTTTMTANEFFGGKPQDYQFQIVSPLSAKAKEKIPQQLEITPGKTEVRTGSDDNGTFEYNVQIPATVKSKGVTEIRTGAYDHDGGTFAGELTGYRSTDPTMVNGLPVYANYDVNGKLTDYEADSRSRSWLNRKQSISGAFDANGNPKPITHTSRGAGPIGFARNVLGSLADMGIVGQLALMYATGGAGSALAGQLGGGALANAAATGLISGGLSEIGGGDFGKGFLGGAVGSGVGSLVQGAMPAGGFTPTGVPMVDSYLTKALPGAASSAARTGVLGGDALDAGLYSLLNTGVGMGVNAGTNMLLGEAGLDKLGLADPYAKGIVSNLLSGAITGKDVDINKAITNTATQQLLQAGKQAAKTATVP